MLKEQHRRTLTDMAKLNHQNKELKHELLQLNSKLQSKDNEIDEMKSNLDPKKSTGKIRQLQEKDMNLPRAYQPKSSISEKSQDGKTLRSSQNQDSFIEKLTLQNKNLKKELDRLGEKLKKYEDDKLRESTERQYRASQEFPTKFKMMESCNQSLLKENEGLRIEMEKVNAEASQLKKENLNMKKTYEELKSRYESLETTATSNRADYSSESGANSESTNTGNGNRYNNQRLNTRDSKYNSQTARWQVKSSIDLSSEENRKLITEVVLVEV